jgi:hypothetical protein
MRIGAGAHAAGLLFPLHLPQVLASQLDAQLRLSSAYAVLAERSNACVRGAVLPLRPPAGPSRRG